MLDIKEEGAPLSNTETVTPVIVCISPAEEEQISEDKKQILIGKAKAYHDFLEKKLGRKPTFADVMESLVSVLGEAAASKAEKTTALSWKLAGYGDVEEKRQLALQALEMLEGSLGQKEVKVIEQQISELNVEEIETHNGVGNQPIKNRWRASEKNKDLFFKVWALGLLIIGLVGAIIRFLINPEIPTWFLTIIIFGGCFIFFKYYNKK